MTLACASRGLVVATPTLSPSVVSAECYSLAYSDPAQESQVTTPVYDRVILGGYLINLYEASIRS